MNTQKQPNENSTLGPYLCAFDDDADLKRAMSEWARAMIHRVKNATPKKQLI